MSRTLAVRHFKGNKIIRGLGAVILLWLSFVLCGCGKELQSYSEGFLAMDTYMEITVYDADETKAEEAIKAAKAEIERLDALLSTGDENSEVSQINQNAGGELSADTKYLFERSIEIFHATNGAFDITIYPVMRAWGFTDQNFRVPEEVELEELLNNVNAEALTFHEEDNKLQLPQGVEIDFGGIAKGYTSYRVIEILKEYGIEHALLNLGGNVHVLGTNAKGTSWNIAIQNPENSEELLGAVQVTDCAVITSGGYERYFEENGVKYHHIIDPKTGYPAYNGLISVTIVCADSTMADGLSTALFVMGTEEAKAYYQAHKGEFECILYDEEGTLYISEGLKDKVIGISDYKLIK